MKWLLLVGLALGLASCYAVTESDQAFVRPQAVQPGSMMIRPSGSPLSNPTVVTTKGVLAYNDDLQACRASAAASLGPVGIADDVPALKRALKDGPAGSTVAVKYESDDLAVKRDRAVKDCLSRRGYIVRR